MDTDDTGRGLPALDLAWDAPTATAALVLAALAFLWLVRRGFRGVNVGGLAVGVG